MADPVGGSTPEVRADAVCVCQPIDQCGCAGGVKNRDCPCFRALVAEDVGGSTPTPADPDLHLVEIVLCTPCMNGDGGECHSPGCALWLNRAPDLSLWDHPAAKRIERC